MSEKNFEISKPLYATVGAGDAVVQAVADVVTQVRERAETAGTDVSGRVEDARERIANVPADVQEQIEALRERLAGLPSELPEELASLREKFTPDELRNAAESYLKVAVDLYSDLAVRGEEAVGRIRSNSVVEGQLDRVSGVVGKVSSLTGRAEGKAEEVIPAVKKATTPVKSAVKKATEPAKTAAKKATVPVKAAAKKTPARKTAAKKTTK